MDEHHVRLHARITGRVQGVSFRFYTVEQANTLNLTGWVRNNRDRSVEVVAEGTPDALHRLNDWLQSGPAQARVEEVSAEWEDATGEFNAFRVTYDFL